MKQRQTAFTLFEVLIAILILSVGLLGLASLQANSLRSNNSSYMRSQASVLAYDMADRIRANRTADYIAPLPNGAQLASCLTAPGCSPNSMAQNDIFEWQTAVGNTLPLGSGAITLNGNVYTISISWDDNFSDGDTAGQTFTTRFIP